MIEVKRTFAPISEIRTSLSNRIAGLVVIAAVVWIALKIWGVWAVIAKGLSL